MSGIQCVVANNVRSSLLKLEHKLRKELEEVLSQEELLWFQRSREECIVSGDRNTQFYHVATSIKKNQHKFEKLKDEDGNWITEEAAIQDHIRTYYSNLYTKDNEEIEVDALQD